MNEHSKGSLFVSNSLTTNVHHAWSVFWQAQNQFWRTEPEIDKPRQEELIACLATKSDVYQGIYPFKNIKLTRADIEWLLGLQEAELRAFYGTDANQRQSKRIDLRGANLRGVNLQYLPLTGLCGGLNWEIWNLATTEQREAAAIHLEEADLSFAHLEGAILRGCHFERANLYGVHLEGAYLYAAHLEGAVLNQAFFDSATQLGKIILGNKELGFVSLADIHWSDVNLTVVDWEQLKELGDDQIAPWRKDPEGVTTIKERRIIQCRRSLRANRQLTDVLQRQGLNEEAARFAYRAKKIQRQLLIFYISSSHRHLHQRLHTFISYLFSLFLDLLAGYGYKPMRSLLWYLFIIFGFSGLYFIYGHLTPLEAIIFSLTSFHGRGFFPGSNIALSNPLVVLAAIEAVGGLFVEISFIATFTQRYFGK